MARKTYSNAMWVQQLPVQSLLQGYGMLLQVTEGYIH